MTGVAHRLALAGLRYPTPYPELAALEMAVTMSAGMVAWMRQRGYHWASTLEMTGAMFAPAVALVPPGPSRPRAPFPRRNP